jgi:pilus assembly protein CpaF
VSTDARIAALIRRGEPPDVESVAGVTRGEAARLGREGAGAARRRLASDLLGLGPLEECVADQAVTDVLVNGDGSVWVDRGDGLERAPVALADPADARRLAVRLAALSGRRLDESQPWVDGLLPGGVRLHAILPPLVDGGVHLSLRVPRSGLGGLDDLAGRGMFEAPVRRLVGEVVAGRVGFVVSGGTGSGKTTLLAAMLAEVPHHERIVVVEDVRELGVGHPHVVRLQGRGPNVEGGGAVGLVDLVRQALRMRPDRLVVGEVRGAEVREMLAALNTGHEGGCGTVHANSPKDVPTRFEALGALAGLGPEAVHAQLASAVQVVIHLERGRSGRRVTSLGVLRRAGDRTTCDVALDARTGVRADGWPRLVDLLDSSGAQRPVGPVGPGPPPVPDPLPVCAGGSGP